MNRQNFFFDQAVAGEDFGLLQTNVENADDNIVKELIGSGIVSGLKVDPNSPADMTVIVRAGYGYDQYGRRVCVSADKSVSLSVYAVAAVGNERWLTIVGRFARNEWDPRQDGLGQQVLYRSDESYSIAVLVGVEAPAGTSTKSVPAAEDILLRDVKLSYGQTQIIESNLDSIRRQLLKSLPARFDSITGHKHTGAAEDAPPIETAGAEGGYLRAKDLLTAGYVVAGGIATKNGTNPKQLDVTAITAVLKQLGGAFVTRDLPASTANQFLTATASTTYYLDLNPDGTWSWGTSHSTQGNYLAIAQVTTDASGNININTDKRQTKQPLTSGMMVKAPDTLAPGSQETGYCGIQGQVNAVNVYIGTGVNFKTNMSNIPSSVTLTQRVALIAAGQAVQDITVDGFFFNVASTAAGTVHWYGTYVTVGN